MSRTIWRDADWREPGQRPRGWDVLLNQHHADSKAALIDKRPEPGVWQSLGEFIQLHPRTWRVAVALTAGVLLAQIGSMG